uniref:PH domain-containing protein n=1 Tax=Anopheles melas TaxID=34690 RepID=A0A182TM98_9DIPT
MHRRRGRASRRRWLVCSFVKLPQNGGALKRGAVLVPQLVQRPPLGVFGAATIVKGETVSCGSRIAGRDRVRSVVCGTARENSIKWNNLSRTIEVIHDCQCSADMGRLFRDIGSALFVNGDPTAVKEGYLMKQTWSFQRWRRRYFRLKGHKLYYAKDSKFRRFRSVLV